MPSHPTSQKFQPVELRMSRIGQVSAVSMTAFETPCAGLWEACGAKFDVAWPSGPAGRSQHGTCKCLCFQPISDLAPGRGKQPKILSSSRVGLRAAEKLLTRLRALDICKLNDSSSAHTLVESRKLVIARARGRTHGELYRSKGRSQSDGCDAL